MGINDKFEGLLGRSLPLGRRPYAVYNPCNKKDIAYILGVILGDGSVFRTKGKSRWGGICHTWCIKLTSIDMTFIEKFKKSIVNVVKRPISPKRNPTVYPFLNKIGNKTYRISVVSKCFGEWYNSLSLKDIETLALGLSPEEFLAGMYDSDGTHSKYYRIIYNTNLELLKLCQRLLTELKIESDIRLVVKERYNLIFLMGKIYRTVF